jgi:hypothetical protein
LARNGHLASDLPRLGLPRIIACHTNRVRRAAAPDADVYQDDYDFELIYEHKIQISFAGTVTTVPGHREPFLATTHFVLGRGRVRPGKKQHFERPSPRASDALPMLPEAHRDEIQTSGGSSAAIICRDRVQGDCRNMAAFHVPETARDLDRPRCFSILIYTII